METSLSNQSNRDMRTLLFLFFGLLLFACKPEPVAESGQPLGAQQVIQVQKVYVAWHLTTATGAMQRTGATWISTKAFLPTPQGQTADPAQLLNDLVRTLMGDGTLTGIDLSQTPKNRLQIVASTLTPREAMILDSWKLPRPPKS